jgi:predicted naringenin-chalcone synthase
MTLADTFPLHREQRTTRVSLLGIGTAVPPSMRQADVTTIAEGFACETDKQRAWLRRVFLRSGVESRGSVLIQSEATNMADMQGFYPAPPNAEYRGPTTAARMERYASEAPVLAATAAHRALAQANQEADAITHLITVSCTGFVAPGLDAALIQRLSLPPDVNRQHIGFMGCHAAFNALGAARSIVRADPSARVLACCVELCSLHFAYGWAPGKLVANALFGDGAAAAVVGNGEAETENWELRDSASLLLPDSLDAMTWRIGDHGFEMTLSPELPAMVEARLRPWCEEWLGKNGLAIADIPRWAIHPGGPKILTAAAAALGIGEESLKYSREVLAAHGNMSSATILFVLNAMAKDAEGPCVALGFGPGLMMEGMLLERTEKNHTLKSLLAECNGKTPPTEVDWGPPAGQEIW